MIEQEETYVEAVNLKERIALMSNGEVLPIIKFLDMFGEDCDDPQEAVGAVAGPDADGKWAAIMLSEFNFNKAAIH